MKYLRNNSVFVFWTSRQGKGNVPVTFRDILDAMWLFNDKFERAIAEFDKIKTRKVD